MLEYFKYELLDDKFNFIRNINSIEKCSVNYASLSRLKLSAMISCIYVGNEERFNSKHRIRVAHNCNGKSTVVATVIPTSPIENRNGYFTNVDIDCYSILWLLDAAKTEKRFVVGKGINVVNEVRRIAALCTVTIEIPDSLKATATSREYDIGTPWLDICNDLLNGINYTSLYPDAHGKCAARQYVLPFDRVIEVEYRGNDENNILHEYNTKELDKFNVHNVYVKYVNNPDTPNLVAVFRNDNPQSETSTVNAPINTVSEEISDASDTQTLFDLCKRDCTEETSRFYKTTITTAINPVHGYMTCAYINLNGVEGKFVETSWGIECKAGGDMFHELRKEVNI